MHHETSRIADESYRAEGAARYLGVSRRTLAKWRRAGTGPAWSRIGERILRYSRRDLDVYLAARRVVPAQETPVRADARECTAHVRQLDAERGGAEVTAVEPASDLRIPRWAGATTAGKVTRP